MATITVGIVIGKMTDAIARVAIEINAAATVVCVATHGAGNSVSDEKQLVKDRFTAFELTGLLPDTEFSVSFQGVSGPVPGKFKTSEAAPGGMNIGAASCNFTIRRDDTEFLGRFARSQCQSGQCRTTATRGRSKLR